MITIEKLANNAKKIQAEQMGTKMAGAIVQVCKHLTIDECAAVFQQVNPDNVRWTKNIQRTRDGVKGFTIDLLRHAVTTYVAESLR